MVAAAKNKIYQISKEKMENYKRSSPANEDNIFEQLTESITDILEPTKDNLKQKSKNRQKINGSLLDNSDIMNAPIVHKAWKVPANLNMKASTKVRLTTANHGFLKDSN